MDARITHLDVTTFTGGRVAMVWLHGYVGERTFKLQGIMKKSNPMVERLTQFIERHASDAEPAPMTLADLQETARLMGKIFDPASCKFIEYPKVNPEAINQAIVDMRNRVSGSVQRSC